MCIYIYINIYKHTCIHVYIYIERERCMYVCICVYVYNVCVLRRIAATRSSAWSLRPARSQEGTGLE